MARAGQRRRLAPGLQLRLTTIGINLASEVLKIRQMRLPQLDGHLYLSLSPKNNGRGEALEELPQALSIASDFFELFEFGFSFADVLCYFEGISLLIITTKHKKTA